VPNPTTAICLYRVQPAREDEFRELLRRHWPTLQRLGLATAERPQHFCGEEQDGGPIFVEIFRWASEAAADRAHEHPEVMAIWEPMGALTESRGGRPAMEFPHVRPLDVLGAA
jgi:hypothetical protein